MLPKPRTKVATSAMPRAVKKRRSKRSIVALLSDGGKDNADFGDGCESDGAKHQSRKSRNKAGNGDDREVHDVIPHQLVGL